jgi:hypothetical protein
MSINVSIISALSTNINFEIRTNICFVDAVYPSARVKDSLARFLPGAKNSLSYSLCLHLYEYYRETQTGRYATCGLRHKVKLSLLNIVDNRT